jgi:hypothetical protein
MSSSKHEVDFSELPVGVVQVNACCPTCNVQLKWSQQTLTMMPPRYPHSCPLCLKTWNLDNVYPHIEYRMASKELEALEGK